MGAGVGGEGGRGSRNTRKREREGVRVGEGAVKKQEGVGEGEGEERRALCGSVGWSGGGCMGVWEGSWLAGWLGRWLGWGNLPVSRPVSRCVDGVFDDAVVRWIGGVCGGRGWLFRGGHLDCHLRLRYLRRRLSHAVSSYRPVERVGQWPTQPIGYRIRVRAGKVACLHCLEFLLCKTPFATEVLPPGSAVSVHFDGRYMWKIGAPRARRDVRRHAPRRPWRDRGQALSAHRCGCVGMNGNVDLVNGYFGLS